MTTWNTVDFDIYLYNPAGSQVASSLGVTRQETIAYRPTTTGIYKLEVRSYSGLGPYFTDISAGLASADAVPPASPSGLAVNVPLSNGKILNLSWNANTEPDLAGYNVYRGTATGGPYQKVNAGLVTANSFTDSNLTNGITYFYVVTAADTSGNESSRSAEAIGTPVDNKATAITGLTATPSSTSAVVSWTTDEPADSIVEYGTTSSLGLVTSNASMVTGHSINLSGLSPSTGYFYQVKSKDTASNLATSVMQSFTTLALPGAISGVVTDASTNAPLSGATVTDGTRSATTDTSGAYTINNVTAGTYTVTVSRIGYSSSSKSVTVVSGTTSAANFALVVATPTTGTITGKVTSSSTGLPISGARITAGSRAAFTNASGNYIISNLAPGTYQVQASASGYKRLRKTVTLTAGNTIIVNFSLNRD